ncbi:branched-chain amino acid ABC transporter permease [Mesorhizobium sp. B263B2A]|uniref:branched-chain amino acid ABC transporter permease n=1 Tax=Mesorhizobium sp. B263B2A TaxID=2876669 RepID=UPI001CD17699|nr:branched-chain amino acid ABC transporter permease [Mesorhizobium sp. B263B2A]MCA0035557.1 branched-chain amino acid ABC transporter permease [Mesorhizobium sp. B263B2A]
MTFNIPPPDILLQLSLNGALGGAMYGVAAVGLSLIFGTMRLIFLAQGAMIILAAYFVRALFYGLGIDPFLSLLIVIPVGLVVGWLIYQGLFRKAAAAEDRNISLLIAVGLMFLIQNLMTVVWGGNTAAIVTSYTASGIEILGVRTSFTRSMGFLIALAGTGLVVLFLRKTLVGKAVRAASEDMEAATLMGISPHRVNAIAFAIGIALAGAAGVAVATTFPFNPFAGFIFSLKALVALALGGIGNVAGALAGGMLLGLIEAYVQYFISGGWTNAIAYGVFLAVLMFKPEGLFSRPYKKA